MPGAITATTGLIVALPFDPFVESADMVVSWQGAAGATLASSLIYALLCRPAALSRPHAEEARGAVSKHRKSGLPDLRIQYCRSRVNPRSVGRPHPSRRSPGSRFARPGSLLRMRAEPDSQT